MAGPTITTSGRPPAKVRGRMPRPLPPEPASPIVKPDTLLGIGANPVPDAAEIQRMIAEAAYYLAEKRNFAPGFEEEDWATATAEVMAQIGLRSI